VPVDSVLRTVARLGPYFTWEPFDGDPGWRPLSDLLDADVVASRVGVARSALVRMTGLSPGEIGEREVASITFLGYASRLLSPLLGAAALTGTFLAPAVGDLWWRPVDGGPLPIAYNEISDLSGRGSGSGEAALELGPVGQLLAVFGKRFSLPEHLLWGNAASALAGAAGMIAGAEPAAAARAAALVDGMLQRPPLAGTATLERPDPAVDRWFLVRNNCCLYYRIPGGGTCGDCVLTPDDVRRRQWRSALQR
jgi:ferric iron reductase protein FhuF